MNLGLVGSLEAQLALETVIQVGAGGCAHPVQGRGAGPMSGERWVHLGGQGEEEVWGYTGPGQTEDLRAPRLQEEGDLHS